MTDFPNCWLSLLGLTTWLLCLQGCIVDATRYDVIPSARNHRKLHHHLNSILFVFASSGRSNNRLASSVFPRRFSALQAKADASDDASEMQEDDTQDDGDDDLSLESFQKVARQQEQEKQIQENREVFDGYALRDVIYEKWNYCYDVEFNRVDSFGFRCLYLNILPFYLGGRRFRHETEMDYLCHLQAVVEILDKYDQIGNVLVQIDQTKKRPRGGTSPLVAVPIRLDLSTEEVTKIIGY